LSFRPSVAEAIQRISQDAVNATLVVAKKADDSIASLKLQLQQVCLFS
jgi:hypothetical protein